MKLHIPHYEKIEELCTAISPHNVLQEKQLLEEGSEAIINATTIYHQKVKPTALGSAVLLWTQQVNQDQIRGKRNLTLMVDLLESGILPLMQNKEPCTLGDFSKQRHHHIIDGIRSHPDWLISKQEDMVNLYVEFALWLSNITCDLITTAVDLDRTVTAKRKLPFEKYIQLLSNLSLRERIFVKLYYLGGARALDDVLNIKIQDIDFGKNQISFSDDTIYYSKHVIDDLYRYIESRKTGFVFVNKLGKRINATVPYRTLKLAASKLGFPSSFAFKDLVQES